VIAIILESFKEIYAQYGGWFSALELISIVIFTIEYLARIWTADLKYPSIRNALAIIKLVKSPLAVIDLLAILPFYLPAILPVDLRVFRLLRLSRLLRVFKLTRYSEALQMLGRVMKRERDQLFITFFVTSILLLLAATLMYHAENSIQPDSFPNILASFWWAVATLTTVGYGDVYPVTVVGKILSAIVAILGIGIVALPTGILASGFMKELDDTNSIGQIESPNFCPHCGNKISNE
jgi:voltage-gated potassium channel